MFLTSQKKGRKKNRRFNERHDKVVKCMLCHDNDSQRNSSSFQQQEMKKKNEENVKYFEKKNINSSL